MLATAPVKPKAKKPAARTPLDKLYGRGQARYLQLLEMHPLRPVRTEEELDAATEVIHLLIDQTTRTKAEDDYLAVLTDLVEAYEKVHYPEDNVTDIEMLAFLIESKECSQADVAKGAGIAVSTVSEILSGKRTLNRKQIGKLAKFFNVSPAVFDFPG